MPITKSAKKALRQNITRRDKNNKQKKSLKITIKNYVKLVESKEKDKASENLKLVFKALDKAVKTNLIKKNKASRLKSRLSKKIRAIV